MGIYGVVFIVVVVVLISIVIRRNESKMQRMGDQSARPPEKRESEAEIDRLLQMGRKIEAIKVYRALHNVGLKEAKEAVEKREREIGVR